MGTADPPRIFVCAAEVSGDMRGAGLVRALRARLPGSEYVGAGGSAMAAAGVEMGPDLTDASTIGWFDHLSAFSRYAAGLRWIRRAIRRRRPRAVVVIDAPGIGFPTAKFARALGIPVVYYITPQTWLWAPDGAVARLRRHADIVVPLLRAEAELYSARGLDVIYEGHPIVDDQPFGQVQGPRGPARAAATGGLAVVPGSRRHAIRRLLPSMLDAADLVLAETGDGPVRIAVASRTFRSEVEHACLSRSDPRPLVDGGLGSVLRSSRVAIAASGSNLIEAVLAGVPAVACYRIDVVSYAVADYVMNLKGRMPAFTIPNILARAPVIPELIQNDVTPERIAGHAIRLAREGPAREAVLEAYGTIRGLLGQPGVAERVAEKLVARLRLG